MTLIVTQKQSFAFSSGNIVFEIYSQGYGVDFFLNETSILFFGRISDLSFYLSKNELRENCQENHYVEAMTPDIYFLIFTQVRHVHQNFGTRTRLRKVILQLLSNPEIAGLRPAPLFKRRLWLKRFPVNFEKNFQNSFFYKALPVAASVRQFLLYNFKSQLNLLFSRKIIQQQKSSGRLMLCQYIVKRRNAKHLPSL